MKKKLLGLGALIMACQLTTAAYGVKKKILEFEADGISSNIWSGIPISEKKIRESLRFLDNSDSIESITTHNNAFNSFYETITNRVKDKKFIKFAEDCRKIYEESDSTTKTAIYLLLERITEKYSKDLTRADLFKSVDNEKTSNEEVNKSIFNAFINADKDMTIITK